MSILTRLHMPRHYVPNPDDLSRHDAKVTVRVLARHRTCVWVADSSGTRCSICGTVKTYPEPRITAPQTLTRPGWFICDLRAKENPSRPVVIAGPFGHVRESYDLTELRAALAHICQDTAVRANTCCLWIQTPAIYQRLCDPVTGPEYLAELTFQEPLPVLLERAA